MPSEVIQIVGALLNMGAFALLHFQIAPSSAFRYLLPNLLGSILLIAYTDRQWGFVMLEAGWVVVCVHAITTRLKGRHPRVTSH